MKRNAIRMSRDDRVFYGLVYGVIAILCIIVAYPLIISCPPRFPPARPYPAA